MTLSIQMSKAVSCLARRSSGLSWRSANSRLQEARKLNTRSTWLSLSTTTSSKRNFASSAEEEEFADRCDIHIIKSPFPSIQDGPYQPLAETIIENWEDNTNNPHRSQESIIPSTKVATIDGTTGYSRTYGDYYKTMGNLAAVLKYDMNIQEESTIALYAPNHVDYLPVTLAVSLTGAKVTPINPVYTSKELQVVLERSRSEILIVHHSVLDTAMESLQGNNLKIRQVIVMTDEHDGHVMPNLLPEGATSLDSLWHDTHSQAFHETVETIHKKTATHPFLLPYSSGTTGLPKGVCLTHENIVANLYQYEQTDGLVTGQDCSLISPLPYFHIYAFTVSMIHCAWKGMKVITTSGRFDLEQFCSLIEEHKPQRTHLVPPIILGLGKHPIVDKYDMSSLQMIISAAAPLGIESELECKERLGCNIKQAWGMSELSPIGTINSDFDIKSGSVGPLVSTTYGKIVDPEGNTLGPNVPGELLIKGPQVMMGYLDEPEKTKECLSDSRWLRTGDVAYYDEDGFIFITDRIKELIKVRGYQVAPAELEALLLTNEHVADCAVIQIPDEAAGELPRAYIVLKQPDAVTQEEIYEWVKERVAPYKRLDGGIIFTDMIPKSASGKILRRILRDQVAAEES